MFSQENGGEASIGDYGPIFINLLEQVQRMHPELFTKVVFIGEFSIRISLRRGATMEA